MTTRKELIKAVGARYRSSPRSERKKILDEFVALTGCHRKHAITTLSREPAGEHEAATRNRVYGEAVRQAFIMLWEAGCVFRIIVTDRFGSVTAEFGNVTGHTSHPRGEPDFGRTGGNRFDAPGPKPAFGVTYCAPILPTAFAESVLHIDRRFDTKRNCWVVSRAGVIDASWVVDLQRPHAPKLRLFPLCGDLLTTMNIGNIVSAGRDYRTTREIAAVIHNDDATADGILYVSNRHNLRLAAVASMARSSSAYSNNTAGSRRIKAASCAAPWRHARWPNQWLDRTWSGSRCDARRARAGTDR